MHHWAVSVSLDVRFQPLQLCALRNFASSVVLCLPTSKAVEMLGTLRGSHNGHKIHKRITETKTSSKIYGMVHQIILAIEALIIKQLEQLVA